MRFSAVPLLAGSMLALAALPIVAHHGGAVEWQTDVRGPLVGTATRFEFQFPHVVVYMDVEGPSGVQNWAVTTRWTPTILRRHGWKRDSIVPGDRLVVTYVAHVESPTVVQMRSIEVNGATLSLDF